MRHLEPSLNDRSRRNAPLPPSLSPRDSASAGRGGFTAGGMSGWQRAGRALAWIAATFSVVVLLASGGGYLYVRSQFASIKEVAGLCLRDCAGSPSEVGSTENFLLVGSDTRSGANSTGVNAGLADQGAGSGATYGNSDTTLLVHLSADRSKVIVISFPRDMVVTVPNFTSSTGQAQGGRPEKFNYAFAAGGPALLVKQVEQLTGLPVDHYLSIDFAGFQSMVSALDGVTVCLSQAAYDPGGDGSGGSGFKASAGVHKLDGIQALEYVRQRHGLPHGDLDRIQRQQRFLSALIRQAKAPSTLLNPIKLNQFINAIVTNVSKDSGTSETDLLGLANKFHNLSTNNVEFNTVPVGAAINGTGPLGYLGDYLNIDAAKARTLFQAVHDDQDPANPPKPKASAATSKPMLATPPAVPLTVTPARISLAVANGSGITGRGTSASGQLQHSATTSPP